MQQGMVGRESDPPGKGIIPDCKAATPTPPRTRRDQRSRDDLAVRHHPPPPRQL